jgi:hypothetical protein
MFGDVDIIVTPTTARVAPAYTPDVFPLGENDVEKTTQLARFTFLGKIVYVHRPYEASNYDAWQ